MPHQDLDYSPFYSWFITFTLFAVMEVSKCKAGRAYYMNRVERVKHHFVIWARAISNVPWVFSTSLRGIGLACVLFEMKCFCCLTISDRKLFSVLFCTFLANRIYLEIKHKVKYWSDISNFCRETAFLIYIYIYIYKKICLVFCTEF